MKRRFLRLALAILLVVPLLGPRVRAEEGDESRIPGLRAPPRALAAFAERLRSTDLRSCETYFKETLGPALSELGKDEKIDLWGKHREIGQMVIELYRKGGFETVKALAKDGTIPEAASSAIAAFRNAMVSDALAKMAQRYGEIRVNDFSTAPTAQSDIDQTFHAVQELDPATKKPRPKKIEGTNDTMTGTFLRGEFGQVYKDAFGIEPDRMEVTSHAAEATVPDWRTHPDSSEFALKLEIGLDALRKNPEAYFLEGAFRRQVDRRSFESKEPLYRIFRAQRTRAGETDRIVMRRPRGPDVDVESRQARLEVYRETPPEWRKGNAFGATVGNLFFFLHHSGETEVAERAKYLMRSIEDGMGSLLVEDGKGDFYFSLNRQKRREMLRKLYPDASDAKFTEIFHMYQTAERIRNRRADLASAEVRREVYAPILREILAAEAAKFQQEGKPVPPDVPRTVDAIPDAKLEGYLKDAAERFREKGHALLMDNCVRSVGPRIEDWIDPARIDPEKIPAEYREAFRKDPEAFRRNLRLSAMSEIRVAFEVLPPDVVDRIVSAETNPETKKALEGLKERAEIRRALLSGNRDTWPFPGLRARAREIGHSFATLGPEMKRAWNDGTYTRAERFFRMKDLVAERLGYRRQGDLHTFEIEAGKADEKAGTRKIAGMIVNLGNADSLLTIIRAGQESGWDKWALGQAAFMELVSNCPGVAPVLAVKGALFDGEFEGAAVLVGSCFWPGIGQAYLVWNVSKGVVQVIDFEITGGVSDLVYMGYNPEDAGIAAFFKRYLPGRLVQDFIVSRAYAAPPTLLHFVPGGGFDRKRVNMFSFFDPTLTAGLRRQNIPEAGLDPHRRRLSVPFFTKYVNDYCDLRPGTPFGDDPAIRRRFEEIASGTGGWVLKTWLDRPGVREGLTNRLASDYLLGLQRYRLEEGQKQMEEEAGVAEETAELLARVDQGLAALGSAAREYLPFVSGLEDFADLDEDAVLSALGIDVQSDVEVKIVCPDVITPGDVEMIRREVYSPPGRFVKPFDDEWTLVGLENQEDGGPHRGLSFLKGQFRTAEATLRVAVKDARGTRIGQAEKRVRFAPEGGGEAAVGARLPVLKIVVVSYSSAGKRKGDKVDVITETVFLPVTVSSMRSVDEAIEDAREIARNRYGEPAGADWKTKLSYGGKVVVSVTVTAGETLEGRPPPATREMKEGGGPEL